MFRVGSSVIVKLGSYVKRERLGTIVKREGLGTIIIMSVLLALSGGVNILLARKVYSLRSILDWERRLSIGASAPPIIAHTLDGTPTTITFSGHTLPTILYVFSPQCVWCTRNLDNVKFIESTLNGKYQFVGLSMSDTLLENYIANNNLSFTVYKNPDERSVSDFRLRGTPVTLVISQDGKVVKNWYGAFAGNQKRDIENFFGVNLPGVKMDKVADK
jgi:hypothetical protein